MISFKKQVWCILRVRYELIFPLKSSTEIKTTYAGLSDHNKLHLTTVKFFMSLKIIKSNSTELLNANYCSYITYCDVALIMMLWLSNYNDVVMIIYYPKQMINITTRCDYLESLWIEELPVFINVNYITKLTF